MQDRLSIQLNGKIVTSNYFNMRMFRIADKLRSEGKEFPEIGDTLVYEMFDGTEVTNEVLESLEVNQFVYLSNRALDIYLEEIKKVIELKNAQRPTMITVRTMETGE